MADIAGIIATSRSNDCHISRSLSGATDLGQPPRSAEVPPLSGDAGVRRADRARRLPAARLVEQRGWISKKDYVDGLALAQLAPGPLAAQLAIYLGWSKGGITGATGAAAAFILPSFVMVLGLSALYVRFGGLAWMQSAFYGIGAAVIAIVARSALKLVKMTLGQDRLLWVLFAARPSSLTCAIAGAAFVLGRRALIDWKTVAIAAATWLAFTRVKKLPEPLVILAAGLVGLILRP